ncbi:S24 family peptidase [Mesorhizobium sp. 8]|nr:S24 family peptidase [Mesorhizobium sp. 8]
MTGFYPGRDRERLQRTVPDFDLRKDQMPVPTLGGGVRHARSSSKTEGRPASLAPRVGDLENQDGTNMSKTQDKSDRKRSVAMPTRPKLGIDSPINELEDYVRACAMSGMYPERTYLSFGLRLEFAYWRTFHRYPSPTETEHEQILALVEKSSKQLSRYFAGAEVPFRVVQRLAVASGVPIEWLAGDDLRLNDDRTETARIEGSARLGSENLGPVVDGWWAEVQNVAERRLSMSRNIDKAAAETEPSPPNDVEDSKRRFLKPHNENDPLPPGAVLIPRFNVRAAAGAGALALAEDISSYFAVERDWLRRTLPGWAPPNAQIGLVEVTGDSMYPTLMDGDLVVAVGNPPERVVDNGGIFFVRHNGHLRVKRLHVDMSSGDISLISDNQRYPVEVIRRVHQEHELQVLAAVFVRVGKLQQWPGAGDAIASRVDSYWRE